MKHVQGEAVVSLLKILTFHELILNARLQQFRFVEFTTKIAIIFHFQSVLFSLNIDSYNRKSRSHSFLPHEPIVVFSLSIFYSRSHANSTNNRFSTQDVVGDCDAVKKNFSTSFVSCAKSVDVIWHRK